MYIYIRKSNARSNLVGKVNTNLMISQNLITIMMKASYFVGKI